MAVGVSVMAAFRGRSLEGLFGLSVVEDDEGALVTGFGFWASASVTLMLCFSGLLELKDDSYWPV